MSSDVRTLPVGARDATPGPASLAHKFGYYGRMEL